MELPAVAQGLRIMFVCKGSSMDGLGHVMRSRMLAKLMSKLANVMMLAIGDAYVDNILANRGFRYEILESDDQVLPTFHIYKPDVVIFDLINFDDQCFESIAQLSRTVSLSPIFNHLKHVDLVFHRTRFQDSMVNFGESRTVIRAGLEYAIVGEGCLRISQDEYTKNLQRDVLWIAVSMGGTDAANKTLKVLHRIKNVRQKSLFWVLIGEGYDHSYRQLTDCLKGTDHEIILAKTNDSMWHILSQCSMAVLAGGTTTYEAAYAGLPSINALETPRHFFLVRELVEKGVCLCSGCSLNECLDSINNLIGRLNQNRNELFEMHKNSKDLIDGMASHRIAAEIFQSCDSHRGSWDAITARGLLRVKNPGLGL
jgi:spore coat polysaccharide biosynthesis predicted glycosyltransferase SpsG